jgi:hypothetical protein
LIKAIANKRVELSNEEFEYFKLLSNRYGQDSFRLLFDTDNNGIITSISPPLDGLTPMAIVFFMLNVMFAQRIRLLDRKLSRIDELEKKVDRITSMAKISEEGGS